MIYRVETKYGIRDYATLEQAKRNSKEEDYINLVIGELYVLSRVKRKYANPSWVKRTLAKNGYETDDY